jgi:hypothetical protein
MLAVFIPPHVGLMRKPIKHFEREVRRARHLSAWIKVQDRAVVECEVMDILDQRRENRRDDADGRPGPFSSRLFYGGPTPDLRGNLATRQGFGHQVCSIVICQSERGRR